ncbi:MAG TPA: hypothetical protein VGM84_19625 [Steroidobacteraceae bacterium]|jgi:hypothetical protein
MRIVTWLWMGFALGFLGFGTAQAQQTRAKPEAPVNNARFNHQPTPLSANQRRAIQAAGRVVLGSKRGVTEDVDRLALGRELKDLAHTIDGALVLKHPRIELQRRRGGGPGRRLSNPAELDRTATAAVEARITGLRARRVRLQTRRANAAERGDESRDQALAARAQAIETEVQAALGAPPRQRFERLASLRLRLQPKSLGEQLQSETADSAQPARAGVASAVHRGSPTLQTIVRHR